MFNGVLVYQKVNFAGRFQYLLCFNESVTDRRTDGWTDRPSYRDARTHLKTKAENGEGCWGGGVSGNGRVEVF